MEFYRAEPTARTSWRLAILMGVNTRTYKFALGQALMRTAGTGRDEIPLAELASEYAMALAQRSDEYPQAPSATELGDSDFLTVLRRERAASISKGQPTEALLEAATSTMPGMVMQKFHNLRTVGEIPHRFYELTGKGPGRSVRLTPALHELTAENSVLTDELAARWAIVETSFHAGIGRNLISGGVEISSDSFTLVAPARRTPLASVRSALAGFQHGRCFYCRQPLEVLDASTHVDHVFPFAWMRTGSWPGPNLNHVWNLVLACAPCNLRKSSRLPTGDEVIRLLARNDAIANSPHPLRRTLELTMNALKGSAREREDARRQFVRDVCNLVTDGTRPRA